MTDERLAEEHEAVERLEKRVVRLVNDARWHASRTPQERETALAISRHGTALVLSLETWIARRKAAST